MYLALPLYLQIGTFEIMNLDIRHFRLVKAIVEEGSMAKAVHILNLTPSALSHQLREAELQTGAKIFHRINKKLVLTEIGEKILDSANVILDELDLIEEEVKRTMKGETGSIRLSTECYTSYHWLPAVLKKFKSCFPNIDVRIVFEATHKPVQKMLKGEIDLTVTSDPVTDIKVEYIELFSDEIVAVVADSHPWSQKKFVNAEDFKDQNLIIHSKPLSTVTVHKKLLMPHSVKPANLTVLPLTEASIELVKAGMGVTVMAKWALKPFLKTNKIKIVRVTSGGLHRQHYAAILKDDNRPEYYDYFIRFLKEEIKI